MLGFTSFTPIYPSPGQIRFAGWLAFLSKGGWALRLFKAHHDPALNRKLVATRVVFLILAVIFTALIGLVAASGEVSTVSSATRRLGSRAPIFWESSPVAFTLYVFFDFLAVLVALFFFYVLVASLVERRHGRKPLFGRHRYPH